MRDYIFGERNGIYIIDLQKTLGLFKEAVQFVSDVSASGRSILFVGTKRQARKRLRRKPLDVECTSLRIAGWVVF